MSNTITEALDLREFQKATDMLFEQGWRFLSAAASYRAAR